jgi:predicted metal-dependent HD superfamily phosphohydrolase
MVEDVNADVIHLARQIILDTRTHEASVPDAATVLDLDSSVWPPTTMSSTRMG